MNTKENAIELKSVGKTFKLYEKRADKAFELLNPFRVQRHRSFRALNNISLEVEKGSVLGIVGANGSGKSTLLKVISGIITPSSGEVRIDGRLVPLIELGAGFNPEFTGLENIYFYNSINGISKSETDAMLDDIVEFAEIDDFITQPLKVYSSGMYARLAFAVSINIKPDILILDEVLSVGDEMFRRKCFNRMNRFFKGDKTVLFVSHSTNNINQLCTRCIWLNNGELILDGPPKLVTAMYNRFINSRDEAIPSLLEEIRVLNEDNALKSGIYDEVNGRGKAGDEWLDRGKKAEGRNAAQSGNTDKEMPKAHLIPGLLPKSTFVERHFELDIEDIHMTTLQGERVNVLLSGDEYHCHHTVRFKEPLTNFFFCIQIDSESGFILGSKNSQWIQSTVAGEDYHVEWRFRCNLLDGTYFVSLAVFTMTDHGTRELARVTDALAFKTIQPRDHRDDGIVLMDFKPSVKRSVGIGHHNVLSES
jgi:lipopolysaccharide transport system ATP-binding protein